MSLPPTEVIREDVARALAEDVGSGDISAALIPATRLASATIISRESGVLSGEPWANEVCHQVDEEIIIHWQLHDGDDLAAGQTLCQLQGPARSLLTAERCMLNFLQTLSGTATTTRRYVQAVAGTGTRILDTRKTLPGLRRSQKYAVTCGGGHNHRMGLYDAFLIKENHIASAGSIATAVASARSMHLERRIQVEVETLEQLQQALDAGVEFVLLDNFDTARMRDAVTLNAGRARLEASGNISLENIRSVAETGVDDISIGSLTKHVTALDLSMRLQLGS